MTPIESIRQAELVQFEREGSFVLFHPETLCFFRLNAAAAKLISDVRAGISEEEITDKYSLTIGQLDRTLGPILKAIADSTATVSKASTSSKLKSHGVLSKAVLMINNYCNLKCTYCYEHQNVFTKKAIDMPATVARRAIDKVYAAFEGVATWMFIGGEPTLSEEIIDFACRYATAVAAQKGAAKPDFCMISNGVRMSDRMFELIREFEIQVTFSVDGPKKVNDLVRIRHDNSGSFDAVTQTIRRYREILPQKIQAECTVTQAHRDAGLSLTEVLDFCARDLGIEEPHIAGAGMPPGNPLNPFKPGSGFYAEYIAAAEASMDALLGKGDGPRGRLDAVADVVYRLTHHKPVAVMCPAGIAQVVVDAFGDIYPCWMFAGDSGHAMGNILRDELRGPKALQVIDRIENNSKNKNPICSACYARGVCSVCIGNNHNGNGRLEDPSPVYCDTVRGTLRVVLERLAAAKPNATAMAAGMAGGLKC